MLGRPTACGFPELGENDAPLIGVDMGVEVPG